jgi:hypothetical protein
MPFGGGLVTIVFGFSGCDSLLNKIGRVKAQNIDPPGLNLFDFGITKCELGTSSILVEFGSYGCNLFCLFANHNLSLHLFWFYEPLISLEERGCGFQDRR